MSTMNESLLDEDSTAYTAMGDLADDAKEGDAGYVSESVGGVVHARKGTVGPGRERNLGGS